MVWLLYLPLGLGDPAALSPVRSNRAVLARLVAASRIVRRSSDEHTGAEIASDAGHGRSSAEHAYGKGPGGSRNPPGSSVISALPEALASLARHRRERFQKVVRVSVKFCQNECSGFRQGPGMKN